MNIINIDISKCVGCNSCMRICPAADANVAIQNEDKKVAIGIDDEKCIKCGACIEACSHGARYYEDDTERFIRDLQRGEKIAIIVAPAIKIAFDGNWRHALQWIQNQGLTDIYDVAFGADICTWAHLRLLEKEPHAKIISQPCAAIVNYILKHRHELIGKLSPIHSPMLCLAAYMKKYLNLPYKIAALSPCIAKKDEFLQTGLIEYNVTFEHLKDHFQKINVHLPDVKIYSEFEFREQQGMEGSIYPRPGGLKENLLIHQPNLNILNSEGIKKVYAELDDYRQENPSYLPQVFDVLNCEFGCNGGPATGQTYKCFQMNSIMYDVEKATRGKRKNNTKKGHDLQFEGFDKKLQLEDFMRKYKPHQIKVIKPTEAQIEQAFKMLKKQTVTDRQFDCHACGFPSCRDMAIALAKGINVPDNCHQYMMHEIEKERIYVANINKQVLQLTNEIQEAFSILSERILAANKDAKVISELGEKGCNDMEQVTIHMNELQELNKGITSALENINVNVEKYNHMTASVEKIAQSINLLSLNASIEAARAGEAGRGFAVVATSIRELSESSRKSVGSAKENDEEIQKAMNGINQIVETFGEQINNLLVDVHDTIDGVKATSENSRLISEALLTVSEISEKVYAMLERTNDVLSNDDSLD